MINSKAKGVRGELKFCKFAREQGYEVRRTAQYCGKSEESADVVGLPGLHVEVKTQERLDLRNWMSQSIGDAQPDEIPIVAHKKSREDWLITLRAEDFFTIYREWEAGQ